jgi:hypothetical protein
MKINDTAIKWLLEDTDPSVKYRTLTELLGKPKTNPAVRSAQAALLSGPEVLRIFSKLDKSGRWPHTPKNFASYTTTYYLMALAELGLDKNDKRIARIADWYLNYLGKNKDCYCAFMPATLRALAMLGYGDHKKFMALVDAYLPTVRFDGGYLCGWKKNKYKNETRLPKSCLNITAQTLLLYVYLPRQYRQRPAGKKLVEYFLKRRVMFKNNDPKKIIALTKNSFPVYMPCISLYHILFALSVLGHGRRKELSTAWALLESKKDRQGRYVLERTPTKKIFSVGKIGQPNKWVTLYAYLAEKNRNQ